MTQIPAFLDRDRPLVPDLVIPHGILPFRLPGGGVRGRLVRLGPLAEALLARHAHPAPVTALAGQALALAAALASALKFRGSFSLQAKGDGPVGMLLADCTEGGALRCHARADPERLAALLAADPDPDAAALLGKGYLAFTVDPGPETERHQGIVAIEGRTLSAMAMHYFKTSEQMRCHLHLACARRDDADGGDGGEGWRASALILEKIADEGGTDQPVGGPTGDHGEDWRAATALARTLREAELLDDALPAPLLLRRLFGLEGLAIDRARALAYGCRCSRARLSEILAGFSADDLDDMVVGDAIAMRCEFCNHDFRFRRDEIGRAPDMPDAPDAPATKD